jgi:hypothetical protein
MRQTAMTHIEEVLRSAGKSRVRNVGRQGEPGSMAATRGEPHVATMLVAYALVRAASALMPMPGSMAARLAGGRPRMFALICSDLLRSVLRHLNAREWTATPASA